MVKSRTVCLNIITNHNVTIVQIYYSIKILISKLISPYKNKIIYCLEKIGYLHGTHILKIMKMTSKLKNSLSYINDIAILKFKNNICLVKTVKDKNVVSIGIQKQN